MIWKDFHFIWLLLFLPLLALLTWWWGRRKERVWRSYFDIELFQNLRRNYWKWGDRIRQTLLYIGLAFLIIALAGPKVGTEVREVKRKGIDLMVALDLSDSMNAEDVKPSRLEKAKYEVERLIRRLKGDRVGLIVFTGEAFLQSPMTLDYSALRLFLDIVDTEQMPSSSTNFRSALETAQRAFETGEENGNGSAPDDASKVLLVISDGEDQGSDYQTAAESLVDQGVSIYTLGIGTTDGGRIPLYDEESGDLIGYKRDQAGQVVTTRLEPDVLREIAQIGQGRYYEIRSGSGNIDPFLGRIDDLQKGELASQEYADFKNRYQLLAAIGLGAVFISALVPVYRRRSSKKKQQ